MPEYIVRWLIEITADTPDEAAREALAIQRDANSSATFFEVTDRKTGSVADIQVSP